MRLIGGVLRLDGGPAEAADAAAIARAMTPPGLSPRLAWRADGPALLAVLDFAPAGAGEGLAEGPDGRLIAADLRLDRPGEAAASFGLPLDATPEATALAALARHGAALPDCLDGDYALAAWDPRARRLTLVRDIAAARPLCTTLLPGRLFAFASLPKGLHGSGLVPPRPDLVVLAREVLRPGLGGGTGYRDIAWLPHGHVLTVEADGTARSVPGWRPDPDRVGTWRGGHEEAAAVLRDLVRAAVETRIPAAGGVAAHLSGGLDSSAVAVLAARRLAGTGRRLAAFAYLPDPGLDPDEDPERPLVEAVLAQEAGIDCLGIALDPTGAFLGEPDADLPVAGLGHSRQERACAAAAATGAGLFLTGAGGDEGATYNGADIHADLLRLGRITPVLADLPARARRDGRPLTRVVLQRTVRPFTPAWMRELEHRWRRWDRPGGPDESLGLLAPDLRGAVADHLPPPRPTWSNKPARRVAMVLDSYLHPRNDAWSLLGARRGLAFAHPLLDRRVIDFTLGLPLERFLHGGHSRQPYRDAMAGILPDRVRLNAFKGLPRYDFERALLVARPALVAAAAALHGTPAATALDLRAVGAAFAGLLDRPEAIDRRSLQRAIAATRAVALGRHLVRLG